MRLLLLVSLVGCGRIGFATSGTDVGDDAQVQAPRVAKLVPGDADAGFDAGAAYIWTAADVQATPTVLTGSGAGGQFGVYVSISGPRTRARASRSRAGRRRDRPTAPRRGNDTSGDIPAAIIWLTSE